MLAESSEMVLKVKTDRNEITLPQFRTVDGNDHARVDPDISKGGA